MTEQNQQQGRLVGLGVGTDRKPETGELVFIHVPRDPNYYIGRWDCEGTQSILRDFFHVPVLFDLATGGISMSWFADPIFRDRKIFGAVQTTVLSRDNAADLVYITRYDETMAMLRAKRAGLSVPSKPPLKSV